MGNVISSLSSDWETAFFRTNNLDIPIQFVNQLKKCTSTVLHTIHVFVVDIVYILYPLYILYAI